jgi:hypothetical protein
MRAIDWRWVLVCCAVLGCDASREKTDAVAPARAGLGELDDAFPEAAPMPPGAPESVSARWVEGQVEVSWAPPLEDGNSPIHGYLVSSQPGDTQVFVPAGGEPRARVEGLKSAAYAFAVQALNGMGEGPAAFSSLLLAPADGIVTLSAPQGPVGGCVALSYSVRHQLGRPADIVVEYDADGSGVFRRASQARSETHPGVRRLRASTEARGAGYSFLWNTSRDLPAADGPVRVRVSAVFAEGTGGATVTSAPVTVRNVHALAPGLDVAAVPGASALAAADFNGDGRLDLAVAGRDSQDVRLLRGTPSGFQPWALVSMGAAVASVVAVDVNRDGKLDLAAALPAQGTVAIRRGQADGTFAPAVRYTVGVDPVGLVTGDFNRDGKPDLASVNRGSGDVGLLLGTGTGGFMPAARLDPGPDASPEALVAADLDRDAKVDLAVAASGSAEVRVLWGLGDGTFEPGVRASERTPVRALTATDLDGDGGLDLVAVGFGGSTVLWGRPGRAFERGALPQEGGDAVAVSAADLDGDGLQDLAMTGKFAAGVLLRGRAGGGFHPARMLGAGAPGRGLLVVDADGNGRRDVLSVSGSEGLLTLFLDATPDRCSPGLETPGSLPLGLSNFTLTGDFNGDGKPDLASGSSRVEVGLGLGDGTFRPALSRASGVLLGDSAAAADFNADGRLDLLAGADFPERHLRLFPGTGDGTLGDPILLPTEAVVGGLAAADFDGDGRSDIVYSVHDSGTLRLLRARADGTFHPAVALPGQALPGAWVLAEDFNGDGWLDVAASGFGDRLLQLRGRGNGTFEEPIESMGYLDTFGPVAGDFNRDGRADLVYMTGGRAQGVHLVLARPEGGFTAPEFIGRFPSAPRVVDFNGDGLLDLVTGLTVLPGRGDGTFGPSFQAAAVLDRPWSVATEDFNGDGKGDIVLAHSDFTSRVLMAVPGWADAPPPDPRRAWLTGGGADARSVASADFNADGRPDLLASRSLAASVQVLRARSDGTYVDAPFAMWASSTMRGLFPEDFDRDGRLDLVALYDNASSEAGWLRRGLGDGTFTEPALLMFPKAQHAARGDVDGNGTQDLLVYRGGLLSYLGVGDGTFRLGSGTSAPLNAPMVTGDFNVDGRLDVAAQGSDGRVYVLLGHGDGRFHAVSSVQGSPLEKLVAGDFNGDGRLDLAGADCAARTLVVLQGGGTGGFQRLGGAALGDCPTALRATDFDGDGKLDVLASLFNGGVSLVRGRGDGTFHPAVAFASVPGVTDLTLLDFDGDGRLDVATSHEDWSALSLLRGH